MPPPDTHDHSTHIDTRELQLNTDETEISYHLVKLAKRQLQKE